MAHLTIHFNSKTTGMATALRIILPIEFPRNEQTDYEADVAARKPLPVLWLLHGGSDNYTSWNQYTLVQYYADQYGYAVIMPDAQQSSYANMAYGPKWLDYFRYELPDYIFSRFNFSRKREDNFIAGMSMGGTGTVKLALLQPERFSVAVPLASAVEVPRRYAEGRWDRVPGGAPRDGKPSLFNDVYGCDDHPTDILGTNEDCFYLLKKDLDEGKELPKFMHCQGTEDHTYNGNCEYRAYARDLGLELDWISEPGMHNWDSWNLYLPEVFKYIRKCRQEAGLE